MTEEQILAVAWYDACEKMPYHIPYSLEESDKEIRITLADFRKVVRQAMESARREALRGN